MNDAADRVEAFLKERAKMQALDPQEITGANGVMLTVADLEELVRRSNDHVTCEADMWSGVYGG